MASPNQRVTDLLRESGYAVALVERWNAHAKVRQDMFGWVDLVCVPPKDEDDKNILFVQCTTKHNVNARVSKILAQPLLGQILNSGIRVLVFGVYVEDRRLKFKVVEITDDQDKPPLEFSTNKEIEYGFEYVQGL